MLYSTAIEALTTIVVRSILVTLTLAFVANHTQRLFLYGLFLGMDWHAFRLLCTWDRHDIAPYMCSALIVGSAVIYTYLLVLTSNPRVAFRRPGEPARRTWGEKTIWATKLICNPRMIGTASQARGIPPPSHAPPSQFVRERLWVLMRDGFFVNIMWLAVILFDLEDFIHPARPQDRDFMYWMAGRVCSAFLSLYSAAYGLGFAQEVFAIIAVATGMSYPKDWPPLFGSFFDATTVAKAWSRVWHQIFRNSFSAFGDLVCRTLGLSNSHSTPYIMIKTFSAFFFSTLLHLPGDYAMTKGRSWFSARLFMAQPLAIVAETLVIGATDRFKFRATYPRLASTVGFVWVVLWMSMTFPDFVNVFWMDGLLHAQSTLVLQTFNKVLGACA